MKCQFNMIGLMAREGKFKIIFANMHVKHGNQENK